MKPTRRSEKGVAKCPVIEGIEEDVQMEAVNGSERQSSPDKKLLEVKQDLYEDSDNEEQDSREWSSKQKNSDMDDEADRLARTVVCMNLAPKVQSKHLKGLFASAGETKMIICAKGTAFVEFVDQEAVAKALALSGSKVLGKPIVCQPSQAQEDEQEEEEEEEEAAMEIEEVKPLENKTSASTQESETVSWGVEASQGIQTFIHSYVHPDKKTSMKNEATNVNKPSKVEQEDNSPKKLITAPEKSKQEATKTLENSKSLQKKITDTKKFSSGQIKSNNKSQIARNTTQANNSPQKKNDNKGGHANFTIYVGNLLFGKITEKIIRDAFKGFGHIIQIQDFNGTTREKPLGFMYITYKHRNEGLAAIKKMNGTLLAKRRIKVSEKTGLRKEGEKTRGTKRPGDPLSDVRTKLSRPNPLMKGVPGYDHPRKRQDVDTRVVWETDARNTIQERVMTDEYQCQDYEERERQRYKSELRKYNEDLLLWERAEEQRRMEEAMNHGGSREDRYGYETVRREPDITVDDERALASVTARAALAGSILHSLMPEGQAVEQIPSSSSVIYEQALSRHGRDKRHSSSQREDLRDKLVMTIPGHSAGRISGRKPIIDDRSRVQTLRQDMISELALIQHGHSSDSRDLRSNLSRHILPKNGDPYQQASHRSAHYSMVDDRDPSVNHLSQRALISERFSELHSSSRRSPVVDHSSTVMPTRSHHRLHSTERKAYASEEAVPRSFSPPRASHNVVKRPATTDYFHHLVPRDFGTNTLRVDSAAAILQNQDSYNSISALKSSRDRGYHNLTSRSSLESVLQDQDPRYHALAERSSSLLEYPSPQNICRGWYCVDGVRLPANTSWNQYEDIINVLDRGHRVILQVELSATKRDPTVARFMLKVASGNPWVYNSVAQLWEAQATGIVSGRVY